MLGSRGRLSWDYRYTVLLLCWFGWITIYLSRSVLAPILPILFDEFGLSHAQGGLLETAYLAGYIAMNVPAGLIANRIGIKKTLIIGILGYALSTALNFLAASLVHLLALRFLLGLFQGVHLPLANTLLSERFGDRQRMAIGFHESGPNLGNSIAYPLTVAIASVLGWRHAFLLFSLPAFALAVAASIFLREEGGAELVTDLGDGGGGSKLTSFVIVLAPLALAQSVYNLCLRALLIFSPSYLVEYRGMSLAEAGLISMLMPAAGFIAKVSSGFVAERVGGRNAICASTALSGVFILSLGYLPNSGLILNFIALGLALYSFSPTIYASITSALPTPLKSMGLGAVTMAGNIIGAFSTLLIGYVIDTSGYQTALLAISGTVLVSTIIIFAAMKKE